jgi:hypothetical protein
MQCPASLKQAKVETSEIASRYGENRAPDSDGQEKTTEKPSSTEWEIACNCRDA